MNNQSQLFSGIIFSIFVVICTLFFCFLPACGNSIESTPFISVTTDTTTHSIVYGKRIFLPEQETRIERKTNLNGAIEYYHYFEKTYHKNDSVVGIDKIQRNWESDTMEISARRYFVYNSYFSEDKNLAFQSGINFYNNYSISLQSPKELEYKESKEIIAYLFSEVENMHNEGVVFRGSKETPFGKWTYRFEEDSKQGESKKHYYNYDYHNDNILVVNNDEDVIYVKIAATLLSENNTAYSIKRTYFEEIEM